MAEAKQKIPAVAIWSQFADDVGGAFEESPHSTPSMMHIAVPGTVQYAHQGWNIMLDTFAMPAQENKTPQTMTRLRTLITSTDDFRFKIYREIDSMFMSTLKFLKLMKDVEIGDPAFDAQFIMRGTDDDKIRQFFSDAAFKEQFAAMPANAVLEIRDNDPNFFKKKLPRGVDILQWSSRSIVNDGEVLRTMASLFHRTLARLVDLGSAEAGSPDVPLP